MYTAVQFFNIYGYWRPGEDPAQNPPWTPTFEPQHYITGITGIRAPINIEYFATEETAVELMKRCGGVQIASVPFIGSGGPEVSDAIERWVVLRDGIANNAGVLAAHFLHSPESFYPHVAENAMWHDLNDARIAGQKLPISVELRELVKNRRMFTLAA